MAVVLYKRQREVLDFVQDFIRRHGFSPTLDEIAQALGLSAASTVHEHIQHLVAKGVLRKNSDSIRSLEIAAPFNVIYNTDKLAGVELPLLGYVQAGKPLEPYDDPTATFRVSANLVPPGKVAFVLQVRGNSMIGDGILPNDFAVLVKEENIRDGDIVVALLENGLATLKRIFREEDRVKLTPANVEMEPIYATNVQIQGKLVAIVRRYP